MSDPYRTSGFPCPGCKSAVMRSLGTRLICDHCEGMMLQRDDLEGNLGASESVRVTDEGPAEGMTCPRCLQAMRVGELEVTTRSRGRVTYCETDGIWFAADALIELFRRVEQTHDGGGPYFGPSTGSLLQAKRPPPLRFAVPASPFEDTQLSCPVCAGATLYRVHDRWPCSSCKGAFVENGALEAMVMDMVGQPWSMPLPTGTEGERGCPVCTAAMIVEELEAVTIDRCGDHGVWFDPTELGSVLHSVGSDRRRGIIGWLKRVF